MPPPMLAQRRPRAPAGFRGAHDPEDGERQAGGGGQSAGEVDRAAPSCGGGHERRREGEHDEGDREVDVEDPRPGDPFGDDATEEHAGGPPGGSGGAVDGEGLHQLLRVGSEEHHQQRQRRRRDQRRAGALNGTRGDLHTGRVGEAGAKGTGGEHDPAEAEEPLGAEEVREAAAEQQEAAERDDVGVEDPRQAVRAEAHVGLDLGQGDADDRRVHDHHELRERDDGKSRPAPRMTGWHETPFRARTSSIKKGSGCRERC